MIRKIHLDFHTRSEVPDIGAGFDPERFAATLADAHVNMLATPGKCQFGNTYFGTRVGHPHPHLAQSEFFPATVAACVRRGIRVQAYFTLGLDDVTAETHPDWRQLYKDGRCARWGSRHMCFASPYIDEVVIPEALEMLERCPGICGFWFDISLYCDGSFYSPFFEQAARLRLGAKADDVHQRWLLGRQLIREACRRIDAAIHARLPEAENYYNSLVIPGEPENLPLQPCHEVENPILFGSPEYMTAAVRWLRNRGQPVVGLVSRFQGPWMDPGTLRTEDQLRFDVARTLALGCHISMGDHRHPDGSLTPEVYRRIGAVYADVVRCEPWLEKAAPCCEAILLTEIERGSPHILPSLPAVTIHAARLLEESGLQFDLRSVDEPIPTVPLVVWPGQRPAGETLRASLRQHLARGGALLAMDAAAVGLEELFGVKLLPWQAAATAAATEGSTPKTEISDHGHVRGTADDRGPAGPAGHFVRSLPELGPDDFPRLITPAAPLIEPLPGTRVLAERLPAVSTEPPCPAAKAIGPFIVQRGQAIFCAAPLFLEALERGAPGPAELLEAMLQRLLPRPLVRHSGGSTVAAHLHRSPDGYVLHLVHWALDRWGKSVNSARVFPPLGPIEVRLDLPEPVVRVTLQPQGTVLAVRRDAGDCCFTVPGMRIWQMLEITRETQE